MVGDLERPHNSLVLVRLGLLWSFYLPIRVLNLEDNQMGEKIETSIIVIGGGATGAGVLRDLALRGIQAILIEQRDLSHGTSSRYHGLLHSGARYAVLDEETAKESYEENIILKRTIPGSIEDTGGFFVKLPEDDNEYVQQWIEGCRRTGIPVEEISVAEALREEPFISKKAQAVYRVPDGAVDGFTMIIDLVADAVLRGSKVLIYHQVIKMIMSQNRVIGVLVQNVNTGKQIEIYADIIINASGPWTAKVAGLAGIQIDIMNNRGMLAVFNHRFNRHVINRLRKPDDADIFVPAHNVTIFGTTGINIEEPDDLSLERKELMEMLDSGKSLVPDIDKVRLIRAFVGVRPLYQEKRDGGNSERNISRRMALIDHQQRDGIEGLITITGGKLTTLRLMAEKTVDLVSEKFGINQTCTTDQEIVPHRETKEFFQKVNLAPAAKNKLIHWAGKRAKIIEKRLQEEDLLNTLVCECEQVTLGEIESVIDEGKFNLGDIRRRTRLGMGPCQGTFCHHRAVGLVVERGLTTVDEAEQALFQAIKERQKGMNVVSIGETAKQLELMKVIYHVSLGMKKEDETDV